MKNYDDSTGTYIIEVKKILKLFAISYKSSTFYRDLNLLLIFSSYETLNEGKLLDNSSNC